MRVFWISLLLVFSLVGNAQESRVYFPETDSLVRQNLEQWKDLKFGLLMHWGPYSQWGVVESWSICSEDEPWCKRSMANYVDYCRKYEKLKQTFNPVNFDPERWASAASAAGMKYVVFTSKHHDGFCMFDTRQTDYRITDAGCPFHDHPGADVTREILQAFRSAGFRAGIYFSKPDWHSNDYWAEEWATPNRNVNYSAQKYPERWQKFTDFTYRQLEELMTGYGKVDILWLDGGWVNPGNGQDINMPRIVQMARKHQPGLIVVDRAVGGRFENYLTPEQQIPTEVMDYPWETCMTMATSWSYRPDDIYKPASQIIHYLADIVSKGGNYLLNIGPGPDGTWPDTAYSRLQEIGEWMKINGEAIYGTRPVRPSGFGNLRFTSRPDGNVYVIYLAGIQEQVMPAVIRVEGFQPSAGSTIELLGAKGKLAWKSEGTGFLIEIPSGLRKKPPCKHAWAFRINMNNTDTKG